MDKHACPFCNSTNTRSIGGEDFDNIHCDDCNKLSIVTWENYKDIASQLEAELTAARTAAGIDAGMPLDDWIKARIAHHSSIVMALYEIDHDVFGPLTCKEGIAELLRQRDEARRESEELKDIMRRLSKGMSEAFQ